MDAEQRNRENRRTYGLTARTYAGDAPKEDDPAFRAACRALLTDRLRGRRVLEVGCGPGTDAEALRREGLDVTATDACEEFVEIVGERFPGVRALVMDMTEPTLPPASFDGVCAFASFVHLPRALGPRTLAALARLLVPGGVLLLTLIRSDRVREYVIDDWGGRAGATVLFTCWDEDEIRRGLGEAGLTDIEVHRVPSELYDSLPRLVERGVRQYQVTARRPLRVD